MKTLTSKLSALLVLCFCTFYVNAQVELWGTTGKGGADGLGSVFKTNYDGSNYQVMHSFSTPYPGSVPKGDLIQATNGKMYGYTYEGGACDYGNLFEFDPATSTYTTLVNFDINTTGAYASGHPIQASNGKLYGMMTAYGATSDGVIFEYDLTTQVFTILEDLSGLDYGVNEAGSFIQATNGKLYALGAEGLNGFGVIYEYDITLGTLSKLFDFPLSGNDGIEPWGSLIQAANGKLYGVTATGGINDYGVMFEYDITTASFSKKADFDGANGRYPYGDLMQASNGLIYGAAGEGGANVSGTMFEFDIATNSLVSRIDFDGATGASPLHGALCEASNGKLYGMTSIGGINFSGTLYEYDPATQSSTVKVEFNGFDGNYPMSGLLLASNGKLYGLTNGGGLQQSGVLIEYNYIADVMTTLLEFNDAPDGSVPTGGFVQAGNGKLYGLTRGGGTTGVGVVYEVDPVTGTVNTVASFDDTNGGMENILGSPNYDVTEMCIAANGKLYGLTLKGGVNSSGSLYEFDPATNVLTLKKSFSSATDGYSPGPGLLAASNGKLYGTANFGGANNKGTLFSFDPLSSVFTKLHDFTTANGANPGSFLAELSPGRIFGITNGGGANNVGAIFLHDVNSGTTTKITDMEIQKGRGPGTLFEATNGIFYVMFSGSAQFGYGSICSYDTTTQILTKLYDLEGTGQLNNTFPGHLTEVNGNLYAMQQNGGTFGRGVIFEFDPLTTTYTDNQEFSCDEGFYPNTSSLFQISKETESLVWPGDCNYDLQVNNNDFLWLGLAYNSSGPIRAGASNNWVGQPAAAWSTSFANTTNYKHADSNGDGGVNGSDSLAISLNYNQTHPFRLSSSSALTVVNSEISIVASTAAIAPGFPVEFDIYVANAATPLNQLLGIAFTLEFDPALIDPSQISISWSPSVLGTLGGDMEAFQKYFPASGRLEVAICRTNQTNALNLYGVIGKLYLGTSSSVTSISNLVVSPSLVTGINAAEELISFTTTSDTVLVDPSLIGIGELNNGSGIYVYPNPATSILYLISESDPIERVIMYNTSGAIVYDYTATGNNVNIPVSVMKSGVYFLDIITGKGVTHKRVVTGN